MSTNSDIVTELQNAANTIYDVAPTERHRLLVAGMDVVSPLRQRLEARQLDREPPAFLADMPALIEMALKPDAAELLVGAGMSMLAAEIERLRELIGKLVSDGTVTTGTLATALEAAGFEPARREQVIVEQGRSRETLRRYKDT